MNNEKKTSTHEYYSSRYRRQYLVPNKSSGLTVVSETNCLVDWRCTSLLQHTVTGKRQAERRMGSTMKEPVQVAYC